ncbi:MAG: acetylornithine deacetylase [Gammaproteobacteria bacterium]
MKSKPHLPSLAEMLGQLVATPSVSSVNPSLDQSNRALVDLLAAWFSELGFTVEILPVSPHPEKVNLIARWQGSSGSGGLVLSGHTDTVPYDTSGWSYNPFKLTEREGRWYGLGTTDMKCFFALVLDALRDIDGASVRRGLTVLATADEESSMNGARKLIDLGVGLGEHALIGEPTGLIPVYKHKGVMMEAIRVQGRSGHASDPALGNSALEGMHRVMSELLGWREELGTRFRDRSFAVAVPTVNFGAIRGGDNPNRICANCELQLDLRLLPGMEPAAIRGELQEIVSRGIAASGLKADFSSLFEPVPPFEGRPSSEIVALTAQLSGNAPGTVAFATEAPFLCALGMETVVCGPGDIDQAHQADEYVSKDRVLAMRAIVCGLVEHFCLSDPRRAD